MMLKIVDYVLAGISISLCVFYMLGKISGNKYDFRSIKTYVVFVIFGLVECFNYYFINGYIKVITIMLIIAICYYILLNKNIKESIVVSCLFEITIMISEFIFSGIMIVIFGTNFSQIISNYAGTGTFIFNLIISVICISFIQIVSVAKLYFNVIKWTKKIEDKFIIVLMMLIMVTINIVYGSTYYRMNTVYLLLINIVLMLIYVYIVMTILNEKDRYIRINDKYNVTTASLNELRDVVSILKMKGHENSNQLKTIRDMVKKKDIKVIKYIDALLGDKLEEDEKLRIETSIITNSVLSSLVYSKMITMKDKGINVSLHVDKAVEKLELYELDDNIILYICKIIGVWLDNAIEAVNDLDTKNIDMHMFVDLDNDLNITIANNYNGKLNLELINDKGYTTKGKDHGYGLSLVKEITDRNSKLIVETEFQKNIFKQNLKVKM